MIRILKNKAREKIKGTCPVCGSEFTFTKKDLKTKEGNSVTPMNHNFLQCTVYYNVLKCPCCKRRIQYHNGRFNFVGDLN